jgi:NADH:ubiquinone oxidoreductase subunit
VRAVGRLREPAEFEDIILKSGTPAAYKPRGSILTPEQRPQVTGDYEPWTPS